MNLQDLEEGFTTLPAEQLWWTSLEDEKYLLLQTWQTSNWLDTVISVIAIF